MAWTVVPDETETRWAVVDDHGLVRRVFYTKMEAWNFLYLMCYKIDTKAVHAERLLEAIGKRL